MSRLRLLRAATGPLLATAFVPGCAPPPEPAAGRDAVFLVSLDTLPESRIGCYGAPDVRTPEIDRIARQGVQAAVAIAPAPLTLPSHTTMLTGLNPPQHGVRENGLFVVSEDLDLVPERLPESVRAAAFVGAFPLAGRFGLTQGFDHYDDVFPPRSGPAGRRHQPMRSAGQVLEAASAWLTGPDAGAAPFVWVHLFDPHYPYAPPPPWRRVAGTTGGGAYEGEVAYLDREIGRFLRRHDAQGAERAATIVLVADHGESLGQHEEISHGLFVYDATQRVAFLCAGPGVRPRLDPVVRPLLDVAPTLLAAYGMAPDGMAGVPLQETASAGRDAYVETKHTELLRGWAPLYGVRTQQWKYIRAPRPELYDVVADPGETVNVLDRHPEIATRLAARVEALTAEERGGALVTMEPDVAEKLRSLGYIATVEPGSAPDSGIDPKDRAAAAAALFRGQEAYLDGDLAAAERLLRRAVQLDPGAKEGHSFLAGAYYGLRRFDLAVEHAAIALQLPPHLNEAPVHVTLGEAYLALDRPAEAREALRAALAEKPDDAKAARLLEQAEARTR